MGIGPIGEDRTEKNKKDSRRWVPYTDLKGRARFQEVVLLSGIGGNTWVSLGIERPLAAWGAPGRAQRAARAGTW